MELEADLYASVRACHASTAFWGSVVTCWLASAIVDAASVMGAASFMQASAVDSSEEAGAAWVGAAVLARDLRG